ncbi:MAG: methyltransferase domain-containing protein [Myxococcales bacterium]|nr:methyltransferase domain-containing protein [Myxococcales bacterium]
MSPCDLCGAGDLASYAARMYAHGGREYDLMRCRGCGLVQVRPLPDAASIASLYDDDYFEKDYDSCLSEASYFDSFPRLLARYGELLDAIEAEQPRGSLYEIGCAGGWFLKLARDRGWRVRGQEITAIGARHATETLGLDVQRAAFPEPGTAIEPADVVYLGHVLEHLASPAAGIAAATAAVRPGGLLVVEVPTYVASAWFRLLRPAVPLLRATGFDAGALLRALKFPPPGETIPPFHLYEFQRGTLERLLSRFGFRVARSIARVPKPDGLADASGLVPRTAGLVFDALDSAARRFGATGGNLTVFARRSAEHAAGAGPEV